MFVYPSLLRTQGIISIILLATYCTYYCICGLTERFENLDDMAALARIEIAAKPEVVRMVFLDFPNWSKIGDPVIRSITPLSPNSPITTGSNLRANFAGHDLTLTVTENSPQLFSWKGNILHLMTESRTFRFLPSEKTPGHTTFVNEEKFVGLFWALVASGIMKEQAAFERFNVGFKGWVEGVGAGK